MRETEAELGRLAASARLLVALDFDGTLAPLQDEPMSARALPEAVAAIARLAALPDTTVAFVSGRTLADLEIISESGDGSPIHLAGSHGAEFRHPAGAAVPPRGEEAGADGAGVEDQGAEGLLAEVQDAAGTVPGAWIEPKTFGFALHTRLCTDADAARVRDEIDGLVRMSAPGWRRRDGRDILEYAWRHEGKDSAVETLRLLVGATAVLFAGDDVTDEDALASLGPDDLGIRVGPGETAASMRVADAPALAVLLDALATARAERTARADRVERAE